MTIEKQTSKQEKIKEYRYNPKPEFTNRMNALLKQNGSDEKDIEEFWEIAHKEPINSIRCNTLKIQPNELKKILEEKGWKISQPYSQHEEIMIIENPLKPGELGRSKEHLLGYYYVQEISSMLPMLSLKPNENDSYLDLCAAPGSKTTQAAALMKNKGNIIANDSKLGRMVVLAANLEKAGASNTLITKRDGVQLCRKLKKIRFNVNKILVDAQCSGEGTLRSNPATFLMWNLTSIKNFSSQQKVIAYAALDLLCEDGEMLYSTCTHAPEENEEVIQFLLDNFDIEIEDIKNHLPLKTRSGITEWQDKKFNKEIEKCARIYPQDNNTEGFFVCKIRKLSNKLKKQEKIEQLEEE
jgi:NOL1/NOP2/sun family putative RNA methylase